MKYLVIIIFSVLLITIAYCIPKFFIWNILGYENWNIYSETGTIGDTFGGLSAPFIGILNVILLIWTLYQQIEFEKKQDIFNRNQISNQKVLYFNNLFYINDLYMYMCLSRDKLGTKIGVKNAKKNKYRH